MQQILYGEEKESNNMFMKFWNKVLALFGKKQLSDDLLIQANDLLLYLLIS